MLIRRWTTTWLLGFLPVLVTAVGCGVQRPFHYADDLGGFAYTKRTFPVAWHVGPIEVTLAHLRASTRPPRATALLIHGLGQNENAMLPLAHRLAGDGIDVTVLRIPDCTDVPGGVPATETKWKTLDQMAGVTLRVIQTSSPKPDLFWGRGLGVAILYQTASRFPEQFDEAFGLVFESPIFVGQARFPLKLLDAERGRVRNGTGQQLLAKQLGQTRQYNTYTYEQLQHLVPGYTSAEGFIRHLDAALDGQNKLKRGSGLWWHRSIWILGQKDGFVSHGAMVTALRMFGVPMRRILTYDANHFVSLTQDVWADVGPLVVEQMELVVPPLTSQPASAPSKPR